MEPGHTAPVQDERYTFLQASHDGHGDVVKLLLKKVADVNTTKEDGATALILASQNGHFDVVSLLLEMNAEVNTAKHAGVTAIMLASKNGHCDIVRLLMDGQAEVNRANENGSTALILASQNGHSHIVKLLLERDAEVNRATPSGSTSLILASQNGHTDAVRILLDGEAEVNTANENGSTALILASQNGHSDIVKLLLERDAEVNAATLAGSTSLILASQDGHSDVVRMLLEREAEVNVATPAGGTSLILASQDGHCRVVGQLLDWEAEVNRADENGSTALILASQNGHSDIVKLLLERDAEVNTPTPAGSTALILASQDGHTDVVRLLLEKEAEVNTPTPAGSTSLILASQDGHSDVVALLLERDAEVNTAMPVGSTSLMLASQNGHSDVVKLLLDKEADVKTADQNGSTALILASQDGHCDVVRLLLQRNADVNTATLPGSTSLILASQGGHCDVVRLLLEREAEVNRATPAGSTALILASQSGYSDVVRLLLEQGADVNAATPAGSTSLMLASQDGHCDVVTLLLHREAEVNAAKQDGVTATMLASKNGHSDVVRLLLEWDAEVNAPKKDGVTAIMLASQNGHCDVVRLLLEGNVEVNTGKQDGVTAMMLASKNGHCDVARLLLEKNAEVNVAKHDGVTAMMLASQNGHCNVVKLLLERDAKVNTAKQDGVTAIMLASQNGHHDIVKLLLMCKADINAVTQSGSTALILASQKGQWNIVKVLIDAGPNLSHVDQHGEITAMYIMFAEIAKKCDIQLGKYVEHIWKNPMSPRSHYDMCSASFALIGALLYNTTSEWFDCQFAKSALLTDPMYTFLPNLFHQYGKSDENLFFHGLEGKISLHTMGTAVVCKLPYTTLQWLKSHHRDKLVNTLGQTPLHLLAMENHKLNDMEEKILLLTETVGFHFSDRDNNGRVPYHIACLCLNAQLILCGLRLDINFRTNMSIQDYLGKTPLAYIICTLCNTTDSSTLPSLRLLSVRKTLEILSYSLGTELPMNILQKSVNAKQKPSINPTISTNTVGILRKYFKAKMTDIELSEILVINKANKLFIDTCDIALLFRCSTNGIVHLYDKQNIIFSVIHLLRLIGNEMGKLDPLFECIPDLKGSVQEYTKCGELDELDTSMKLVKFRDYFSIHISEDGVKIDAVIAPECTRYWIPGKMGMFSGVKFCADFWQILLKALDTEVTRTYIKSNGIIIENCQRKHGFVGMFNISCQLGSKMMLISVDITPSIVSHNLDGYTALLRPRHYDNQQVGVEFYNALELSSSQKDWDFLKLLHSEVICAYALVKMLRSLADTFQTKTGRVYTAEDILPSYMVKTALLWILDPEDKCCKIYPDLEIDLVFHNEDISSYRDDVFCLCHELLNASQALGLCSRDVELLFNICKKSTTRNGYLTVRERILPYVLATKHSDRQEQNGINLQWMQEKVHP